MKEALSAASNGSFLITRRDIIINLLLGLHRLPIAQIILRIFLRAVSGAFEEIVSKVYQGQPTTECFQIR